MTGETAEPVIGAERADERSDRELIDAHLAGDPTGFNELIRRHRTRMWATALHTMANREEAADALQDACLSAFRRAGTFRGDSAVTTWLHRIVVNACIDRLRRGKARPTVPLETRPTYEPADPVDTAETLTTRLTVREALARLPEDQRAALVLVDIQGFSVSETAASLGVKDGTVKSRCARGRARLAVMLGQLNPDQEAAGRNQPGGGTVESETGSTGTARPAAANAASEPAGQAKTAGPAEPSAATADPQSTRTTGEQS